MSRKFIFSVTGDEPVREAVLKTVGAVIGHEFRHTNTGMGEVVTEDFWFMKGILERLEKAELITGLSWEVE